MQVDEKESIIDKVDSKNISKKSNTKPLCDYLRLVNRVFWVVQFVACPLMQ